MTDYPRDQVRSLQNRESKPNPIHVLLVCLVVVAIIFAGSIILSVFYVEQNRISRADQ